MLSDRFGRSLTLQITGDTGGEFRAYRRSFPFEAQLARIKGKSW